MEKTIVRQVAKEFNLPIQTIEELYKDWIKYIINHIESTDHSSYNNQQSIIIPRVGKLICNERKLNAINNVKNGRSKFKTSTTKS
jgi:hypothetical protein